MLSQTSDEDSDHVKDLEQQQQPSVLEEDHRSFNINENALHKEIHSFGKRPSSQPEF